MPYRIFLLLLVAMFMFACDSGTEESNKHTIQGTVTLEGNTSNAGATVALYMAKDIDEALQEQHAAHPGVGAQMPLAQTFDHRLEVPVETVLTEASGAFTFSGLASGKYNVVVWKDGYGCRYLLDLEAGSVDVGTVPLYAETILPGSITTPTTLLADHHYIVQSNCTLSGAALTIEKGAWIRLNGNASMLLQSGSLTIAAGSGDVFHVTSNSEFSNHSLEVNDIDQYGSFSVDTGVAVSGGILGYGHFSFGGYGLRVQRSGLIVENCLFDYCDNGLLAMMIDTITLRHITGRNNTFSETGAIVLSDVADGLVSHCLLYGNLQGVFIKPNFVGTVENSIFVDNHIGMYLQQAVGTVQYCDFAGNTTTGLQLTGSFSSSSLGREGLTIQNNIFRSPTSITGMYVAYFSTWNPITIQKNNFYSSDWFIYLTDRFFDSRTLVASENYWDGLDYEEEVQERIRDAAEGIQVANVQVTNIEPGPYNSSHAGVQD